ncbi:MAG: ABC transporter ATP-binding protein [Bdellovibrionaceae bacterium]|nr:ABC transporter ATP-binding protein [Pseudobdellovibrionaceae bacterium]
MIEVKNLTKRYGDRIAIDTLNFKVKKGEIVGFLGPNGAGKSTTMKIITGQMAPSDGQVWVGGDDVFEKPIEVKKRIGYLPETPPVYMDMYVRDFLTFVAKLKGCESKKIKTSVDLALEKTHLTEVSNRLIQNLSKGFKQRVGIAQALVADPEILILDEPTVGLDPKQVSEIRKLIQALKGHHTVVLSTHILPEVQASCERIIIINQGHIVAEDTLEGLTSRISGSKRVRLRLRKVNGVVDKLNLLNGVTQVNTNGNFMDVDYDGSDQTIESISNLVVSDGAGLLELRPDDVALEDIFIRLTSEGGAR